MEQEQRLDALEEHGRKTEAQLGELSRQVHGLASVQAGQSSKLDEIAKAVTKHEYAPRFDFQKSVQIVRDLFVIAATIGTLSIWLVLTLTAAQDRVTDTTLAFIMKGIDKLDRSVDRLEARGGWAAKTEKGTP